MSKNEQVAGIKLTEDKRESYNILIEAFKKFSSDGKYPSVIKIIKHNGEIINFIAPIELQAFAKGILFDCNELEPIQERKKRTKGRV